MSPEQPTTLPPEKPFAGLKTLCFATADRRHFFKQNTPTGGTYLECWVKGKEFAHILSTVELGTPERLKIWMEEKKLLPSTAEEYDSYFFQLCKEVDIKRSLKNEERQRLFDLSTNNQQRQ